MIRRHAATIIVAVVLIVLLAIAVRFMAFAWTFTDAHMSVHGWTALILGVVFTLVVGIGLMVLVFFSARRGYDEPPRLDGKS